MKNRVIIKTENGKINFYLKNGKGEFWLFEQVCTRGVYEYFKNGRSENEILGFDKWSYNKKLNNTVIRLPREIRYVTRYVIDEERAA